MSKRVELKFLPSFEKVMLSGQKIMTSRFKKCGEPGDEFVAFGFIWEIIDVRKTFLGIIADNYYIPVGFCSPSEFWKTWKRIYPERRDRDNVVWLHRFKKKMTVENGS